MEFAGIDKLSLLDFEEKVSCVLFTKGCNFRCPFCHNNMLVDKPNDEVIKFDEILDYLSKRKGVLDAVVISGGEPTLMSDLKAKIEKIKSMGFLIKLDTNGTNPEVLKDLIDSNLIDYVAMDIKNAPSKYDVTTGSKVNLENIKKSISILLENKVDYEFRTTLVNEFHDDNSIIEMAKFIKGAKKLYLQKFVERETCIQMGLHEVPIEKAQEYVSLLEPFVNTSLRGY